MGVGGRYFREVGPQRATPGERIALSRRDCVETSRLRTGHSTLLAGYRHGSASRTTQPAQNTTRRTKHLATS